MGRKILDGTLEILIGKDWLGARLAGAPLVRVDAALAVDFMVVTSQPESEHSASTLALLAISREWQMPDGMTSSQRWQLIDTDDFDAGAFWNDAAGVTAGTRTPGNTEKRP